MSVAEVLARVNQLQIHTGNINSWNELRQFSDPAEQLQECLRLQLSRWEPQGVLCDKNAESKTKSFCPCIGQHLGSVDQVVDSEREDVKLTLKVFLHEWNGEYVRSAVDATLKELSVKYLESLIVAGPPYFEEQDGPTLELWQPVWTVMEQLARENKALTIGIADADLPLLEALCNWANVKPGIDHYTIEGCCSVPPELADYARAHDIQLLTHNDPMNFLPKEALSTILREAGKIPPNETVEWHPHWVARYTVMIKCRSVISQKAYIVNIAKPQ